MKTLNGNIRPLMKLAMVSLALTFLVGCSSHARSTTVRTVDTAVPAERFQADEFVGVPILGDYDQNPDLDFVLEVVDGDRTFKIKVHQKAGKQNRKLLDELRARINESVDKNPVRVVGYYSSEYKGPENEYGFLDLKTVVFYDESSGKELAYFTDGKDARFEESGYREEKEVTVLYAPVYNYHPFPTPRYYDPWAYSINTWYDPYWYDPYWYDPFRYDSYWYDPFYVGFYPRSRWNMGFMVSYNWYRPAYVRYYHSRPYYYHYDYAHHGGYYGSPIVSLNNRPAYRPNPSGSAILNVKAQHRTSGALDARRTVTSGGGLSGGERLPADRRRLVPSSSSGDVTGSAAVRSRDTGTVTAPDNKTRNTGTVTPAESGRTVGSRERATTRVTGDNRTYVPSSRTRAAGGESEGGTGTAGSATISTRGDSRERAVTTGRTTAPSDYSGAPGAERATTSSPDRYRGSYVTGRSGGYTAPSSSSGSDRGSATTSRSREDGGSYTPSTGSSGNSPAAAARPAPSSTRSAPAPAATRPAPSSGSRPAAARPSSDSRSRDSGSSSGSSRGSGGDRRRN